MVLIEAMARIKALETVFFDRLPESDRKLARWQVDEMTKQQVQVLLTNYEDVDPATAAQMDDRLEWMIPEQEPTPPPSEEN